MTSIAELGIRIDSGDAVQAATDLDQLTDAGKKTEDESKKAGDAWGRALSKMSTNTQQTVRELQSLNGKQDETSRILITVGQSIQQSAAAFASAASAMAALRTQAEHANAAQAVTAQTADKAAVAIVKEASALGEAATKVAPVVDALNKIDQANRRIVEGASKKPTLIDTPALNAGAQALGKTTAQFDKADNALQRTGISAKQTAAALRGVPAQFTDIVVSLQGGQAPLTVLLQQGGQLKDMFGGAGAAARALGGYVAGLVTPFTAAAAAAVALGAAYYKGSEEAEEYRKALILTGNTAGTNVGALSDLAKQIGATVGTTGAAAEVLTQLASSAKIGSDSFGTITRAALEMRQATGRSVEDTVAEFVEIGKEPVAAAKKLNEEYGFLSAATYAQISALKQQGDTVGATRVLTEAYASTIHERTGEITGNLGLIERGWNAVWNATKRAVDSVSDIGRPTGLQSQLAAAQSDLTDLEKKAKNSIVGGGFGTKKRREELQSTIQALTDQLQTQQNIDKAQANYNLRQRESVLSQETLNGQLKTTDSNQKKLADRLKEINELAKKSAAGDGGKVYTDAELNQLRDAARKQFADKPKAAGSVDLSSFNDQKNALAELVNTYQNSYKELDAAQRAGVISQETYTAQRSTLIRAEREEVTAGYEAEIAALEEAKNRASTSATQRVQLDQKIADARTSMVKAQKDADSQLEVMATAEQGRLAKQTQAVKTYTDALNNQVATLRQQGRQAAATLGMGDRQSSLYQAQNAIDDRVNSQKLDLANQYGDGSRGMSLDEYQKKLAALNKTQQDLHDTVLANYNDMTAAQGDWTAGASAAWQNYLDNGQNVAGQMKTAFTDLYDGLTDSLVDFAFGADESFGDVAVSFAKMVAKMALQSAASSVFSGGAGIGGLGGIVSGLFGGGAAASAGSTAAGYTGSAFSSWLGIGMSGGGYTGDGGKYDPKGVVHGGEFVLRKEVVSQPGMRNYLEGLNAKGYADGGYVSGTASRLSGASNSSAPQVHIHIASDGSSQVSSNTQGLESFGTEIGSFVTQKYKELEAKSLSPQGNIRKAINGRA